MTVSTSGPAGTSEQRPGPSEQGGPGEQGGAGEAGEQRRLRAKEQAENFPVALRLLPRRLRGHLIAVYDVVRVIDDLGDEAAGDRTALLEEFAQDLALVWPAAPHLGPAGAVAGPAETVADQVETLAGPRPAGAVAPADQQPEAAVLRRLVPTVRACGLPRELFDRMVAANLQDQRVSSYATYGDLLDYCKLSADPVGRMVLGIFGVTGERAGQLSDRVCTALQLLEHWQDVAEDRAHGRIYLPLEDLDRYGVIPEDLDRDQSSPALRRLMTFQTDRAAALLESGAPLVGLLSGWARVAVAGYVAGGRAAVDALRRCGGDVLAGTPRARRRDTLRHAVRLIMTKRTA